MTFDLDLGHRRAETLVGKGPAASAHIRAWTPHLRGHGSPGPPLEGHELLQQVASRHALSVAGERTVDRGSDPFELEADRRADDAVAAGGSRDPVVQIADRLGVDLGRVQVHQDDAAAQAARTVSAPAFTVGDHVVLGREAATLPAPRWQRLLAHELTHVAQHARGAPQRLRPAPPEPGTAPTGRRGSLTKEDTADIIGLHLIDYREQVKSGIQAWTAPSSDSGVWFGVALAGNLIWAATCLLNPVAGAAIKAMSFAGAIIGSGTAQKLFEPPEVADIKPLLVNQVSTYVDALKNEIGELTDMVYAHLAVLDGVSPAAGWLDADRMIRPRREVAWKLLFDDKVAPWGNSTAIIDNTVRDIEAIWARFKPLFEAVVMTVYGRTLRYKGKQLEDKVLELYYQASVESGVARRSPAVKLTTEWIELREYEIYRFPPPRPGVRGATVSVPTGGRAIPVEVR